MLAMVLGLALLAPLLTMASDAIAGQAGQGPTQVIAVVEGIIDAYDPLRDQGKLLKPQSWCAKPRNPEPLLAEARRIALGTFGDWLHYPLPPAPLESVQVVSDERVCEAAAKEYDWEWYGGGNINLADHTTFVPVVVVSVGNYYLAEGMADRADAFHVFVYDRNRFDTSITSYGVW